MLKKLKKISGVITLSKPQQLEVRGGSGDSYTCPGGPIIVNTQTCPQSHPYMHPQGHCFCCAARWKKDGDVILL